jgi:TolB-like protein
LKPLCLSKHVNTLIFLLIVLTFSLAPPVTAQAQMQQVAIIPFSINAEKDLTYLKEGISQMLSSRLSWKKKVLVIPEKTILDEIKKTPQLSGISLVKSILKHTDAQYVISGSITEFAGTFSLDTVVHTNTSDLPIHTFFGQANTPDDIISEMSIIAAKINNSVLNRNVPSLAGGKNQQIKTEEDLTRANPEKLIPQVVQDTPSEQKPFWKFWEKEAPPLHTFGGTAV